MLPLILVLLNSYLSLSFNLDTNNVIIYSDRYSSMEVVRDKNNYFGYSTILYGGDNTTKPWVLIGAPRGDDLAIPAKNPGVVFRCFIDKPCEKIAIDSESDYNKYNNHGYIDNKDEAWIGGAMDIHVDFDRVVVCAFRWKNTVRTSKSEDYSMQGSCYWARIHDLKFAKLLPLINPKQFGKNIERKRFYYFGQGQSGFAAHITNSRVHPELLIGAPGVFNWEGTTLIYKNLSPGHTQHAIYPNVMYKSNGLYGYAVSSGYYFDKDELLYVGGSPKQNNYLGQIFVYSFANKSEEDVDIRSSRKGSQMGEYFGASLASGDINGDGYTDLLVGAPFYKASAYNEGRVHIFYGSQKKTLVTFDELPVLTGKGAGGQFGTTIGYLGDMNLDGFGDFAIAAPYENEKSGNVYIYNGGKGGLNPQPSQIITGKSLCCNLKGFGISFSKTTDIDDNKYHDLAIGSYLSGHVVILRGKPIVSLKQHLNVIGHNFNVNGTTVEICLWFEGSFLPENITINRTIQVDESLRRVYLEMSNDTNKEEILQREERNCKNYTILTRKNAQNLELPVNIKITQRLTETNTPKQPVIIGTSNTTDEFCKTCPVLAPYESLSMDVPFALGCGEDNVCTSKLSFNTAFQGAGFKKNQYVIGSGDRIEMNVSIVNRGELAYTAKITVMLPSNIPLVFTPRGCSEKNSAVICDVANPLKTDETKHLMLTLNMKNIPNTNDEVSFAVSVSTSSKNTNLENTKTYNISLITQADLQLTGKSNQLYYSYGNKTSGVSKFSQVYQIQKFGKTQINGAVLYINIPIAVNTSNGYINFLKIYSHEGRIGGEPIFCRNVTYAEYATEKIDSDVLSNDGENIVDVIEQNESNDTDQVNVNITRSTEIPPRLLRRSIEKTGNDTRSTTFRELLDSIFTKSKTHNANIVLTTNPVKFGDVEITTSYEDLTISDNIEEDIKNYDYLKDDFTDSKKLMMTHFIDCSILGVQCATIQCKAGPFVSEQQVGVVQIKALLQVSALKDFMLKKDTIVLQTSGNLTTGFKQTGNRSDEATVDTVFYPDQVAKVDTWIIVASIVAGLFLLLFITLGLIKAGFFNRAKKEELEALKKAEDETKPNKPTKLCFLDFQLSHMGSPAIDLSYFIFTCTDKRFREKHYDEMLSTYYKSLASFLQSFGFDARIIFPYDTLLCHMKKYSLYGLMMSIITTNLMVSDEDEAPDLETMLEKTDFEVSSRNDDCYKERIRGVVEDYVKYGYL